MTHHVINKDKTMRNILMAVTLSGALMQLGCSDSDPSGPGPGTASLRVAHLSPDAPAVDVWVDQVKTLTAVPFSAVSGYLPVEAGSHRVQVTPAGALNPIVIDATVSLGLGGSYTVAATGLLGASDLAPVVLVDDRSAVSGSADVRFVHASPDAPAVDIAVTGGGVLFGNVAFRDNGGYITVPAGTYNLEVRVAGTNTVALTVPGVVLTGGQTYTIFAKGLLASGTLAALATVDSN